MFATQIVPESFWAEIRQSYVSMCEILEFVDEYLANLVLIACLIDLYSICLQILNISA